MGSGIKRRKVIAQSREQAVVKREGPHIRFGAGWLRGHRGYDDLHSAFRCINGQAPPWPPCLQTLTVLPAHRGLLSTLPATHWNTGPQRRFQTGSQNLWEGWCRACSAVEGRSDLHLLQGFYDASGKYSSLPRIEPRAPGRGTTIPFSLGNSLCSTPAQSGGQCRYKGLFCSGADARERGRVGDAVVLELGHW